MHTSVEHISNDSTDNTSSGVAWAAIFAGAVAAAALSLILLVLGAGLGFSTVSPWPNSGISAATLGVSTIVWLIFTQLAASGVGGYLAGRLRIKWATLHTDEVYFRDTAHGLLAWGVATLIVATLVGTMMGKTISGIAATGSSLAATATGVAGVAANELGNSASSQQTNSTGDNNSSAESIRKYLVGFLFRSAPSADSNLRSDTSQQTEAEQVLINGIHSKSLSPDDTQYLAQLVANHTGISVEEANKRVNETFNRLQTSLINLEKNARQAADEARKTAANSALWMFVALLSGAFIASFSATMGGKQRDRCANVTS